MAHYLLEAGAVCNEYTFDGDRCHYAALTSTIRCGHTPQHSEWVRRGLQPCVYKALPDASRQIMST